MTQSQYDNGRNVSAALKETLKRLREAGSKQTADAQQIVNFDPLTKESVADRQSDRVLKELYAKRFIWILVGQLFVMNCVFIAVGAEKLKFTDYVLHLYMGGTMLEVFGVVLVITKYLFKRSDMPTNGK